MGGGSGHGLLSVYLAVLLDSMGAMMVMPLLPFLARKMDGTAFEVGLMQAIYSLMQVFGSLILGALGDVIGKRKVLLISLAFSTVFLIAFGLAKDLTQLMTFRGINGFFAGTVSVCQAIVADMTSLDERAGKMALIMAAYGVGVVVGPALAGFLVPYGFTVVCFTAAGFTFGNFFLALWQLPEVEAALDDVHLSAVAEEEKTTSGEVKEILAAMFQDPVLGPVYMVNLLANTAMGAFMGVTALLAHDLYGIDAGGVGRIYCAAGVTMVIFQGVVTQATAKAIGEHWSVVVGSVVRGTAFVLVAAVVEDWVPWIGSIMIVAAGALIDPCTASLVSKGTKEGNTGAALGAFSSLASLGSFLGPLGSGALYELSPALPFWICAGLSGICGVAILRSNIGAKKGRKAVHEPLLDTDGAMVTTESDASSIRAALHVSRREERIIRMHSFSFSLPQEVLSMAAREHCEAESDDIRHVASLPAQRVSAMEKLARKLSLNLESLDATPSAAP